MNESAVSSPGAKSSLNDRDWRVLLDSFERRNCIVLLGPDLSTEGTNGGRRNLTIELSRRLADVLEYEDGIKVRDRDNLPLVAQEFLRQHTRVDLEVEVTTFYRDVERTLVDAPVRDPVFEDLAALPIQLFVSSRHDRVLHHYIAVRGRTPDERTYHFKGSQQRTLRELGTLDRPVIYQLFGSADQPESLVLTESDRMDLLKAVVSGNPALPIDLQNHFREKSFLFLGCGLHEFYLRFLLHVLGASQSGQRSFAVERLAALTQPNKSSSEFVESVWFYTVEFRTLKFVVMEETDFLRDLRQRLEDRKERRPISPPRDETVESVQAPRVFISHMKEDEQIAKKLAKSLEYNGIEPWVNDIPFARNWEEVLEDAIGKDCDFFIVLLSKHLVVGVQTWVYREIGLALKRASMLGGMKFVYPIQVDEEAQLPDAIAREKIQARRLEDVETDVTDLAKDIKREFAKLRRR